MKRAFQKLRLPILVAASFLGGALTADLARATPGDSSPYNTLEQLSRVLVIVENAYVDPVSRDKLLEGAIKGMVAELDPHSAYMPPEENALFRTELDGKFGGVGIEVEQRDDVLIVVAPIEGSPAERAGILPGDHIVSIAGEAARGSNFEKLLHKMRGEPGTTIEVVVTTPGTEKLRTLVITREVIKVSSVSAKRLLGDVAYLRLKQFQSQTHEEMLAAIGKLRDASNKPLRGVILDLRTNPGGLVDQAVGVADELLAKGTIYSTRSRGKVIDEVTASSGGALVNLPAVVLVNEYSASASELVAGALQDNKRAVIVGAQTFGKGSVQSILELPGGAGMRLTTMRYYTPSGRSIQAVGITPDVKANRDDDPQSLLGILKERDLQGYLPAIEGGESPPPVATATVAKPSTDAGAVEERDAGRDPNADFGVARKVPEDPTKGTDRVLSVGYSMVTSMIAKQK